MIEFGKSLMTAREAKGLTIEQLAAATHLPPKVVRQLESEDFTDFAAPIYGRGFVKLYCGAVGLDPKPFLDEFMEIYNGNRGLSIREREIGATPVPPPASPMPEPEASVAEVAHDPAPDLFDPPSEPPMPGSVPFDTTESEPVVSRYSNPMYDDYGRHAGRGFNLPPALWRLTLLGIVAIGVLWGILIGLRALYRSTCGTPAPQAEIVNSQTPKDTNPKPAETKSVATRKPQVIPPLYID